MTTISPRKNGIDPSTSPPATISPQAAIGTGFAADTRIEVITAVGSPTSRSSSSGKETTLVASTSAANRKPTPQPDDRDSVDFDHQAGDCESGDSEKRADRRRSVGTHDLITDPAHDCHLLQVMIDDVDTDFHEVRQSGAGCCQGLEQVMEYLSGLHLEVALAHDVAIEVPCHLTSQIDRGPPVDPHHLRVARRWRQGLGVDRLSHQ
jgi:hypothetical protein